MTHFLGCFPLVSDKLLCMYVHTDTESQSFTGNSALSELNLGACFFIFFTSIIFGTAIPLKVSKYLEGGTTRAGKDVGNPDCWLGAS